MTELLNWINHLNKTTHVKIEETTLQKDGFWYYDDVLGEIRNRNNSFFSIKGARAVVDGENIEQPIIIQDEIGYLGILCKDFGDETMYLMQAKIEPGNINCVQISPTIQATKSNFTQKHGGKKPDYLEYFINSNKYYIVADQIQSEQSSRFYKKRNRNIIIKIEEDVEVLPRFRWMTLKQIKELMSYENLVNMDTRTVLSCLPFISDFSKIDKSVTSMPLVLKNSIKSSDYIDEIACIYNKINDYKMFNYTKTELVPLYELKKWDVTDGGIKCKKDYPYEVIVCDIEIEGREVRKWQQPLFKANGIATFGLIRTIINNEYKFLVKITPEIGCFDGIEIAPTIQKEYGQGYNSNSIEQLFINNLNNKDYIKFDSILSEEGGRFYHEQNRNVIMDVPCELLKNLPNDYFLISYRALNHLNLVNNCLNIQLRNLLSTLEV